MTSNSTATKFINENQLQWLIVFLCQLVFIGFVSSRALASVAMIGILLVVLLGISPAEIFKKYFRSKPLLALSLFFWVVFLSGIYSADKTEWLNWVRIKLPYLALPIAFAGLMKIDQKKFIIILYSFILTFFVSTAIILWNYYSNYEVITESFTRGSAISIPFSHIRYSLMLAFSFFCCLYLLSKKMYVFSAHEKWLQIFFAVFVSASLHVLTVRSGLMALYLGIIFLAVRSIVKEKRIIAGIILIAIVVMLPFVAYRFVPSFHNKINYMKYDLQQYETTGMSEYSDAMRLLSMKVGIGVWKESKLLGVGAGDLKKECDKVYASKYPFVSAFNQRLPHNQFVWVLATTGVVGLAAFILAFLFPFFTNGIFKQWLVVVFHIIVFSSFFTESTIEEQIGTGFYILFLLLLMNYFTADE